MASPSSSLAHKAPELLQGAEPVAGIGTALVFRGRMLGEILMKTAELSAEVLADALREQGEKGGRLGEVLLGRKAINEMQLLRAISLQLDVPYIETIDDQRIGTELVHGVPINFAKQRRVLPVYEEAGTIVVAMADPLDLGALDDLRLIFRRPVAAAIASPQRIIDAINRVYDRLTGEAESVMDDLDTGSLDDLAHELEEPEDLLDASDEAPIIRLVNSLLSQAVKERASDIHIEPFERELAVRFRVDGLLYEIIKPPKRFQQSITSRIKIMGGLNIAEKRLPQDGRIRIKIAGKDIDIRLSTVPTSHGERIVMRLLDKTAVLLDLEQLGLTGNQQTKVFDIINKSHGIFLVTGPTGSGKTTSLYAAITRINSPDLNILTVEDPVEYQLRGIGQVAVNAKIGLTFASGLRAFLRQDPDVILVGEIRDLETAEIAIQASLTGHLVFSTVHTNDAPGAITRLVDMGVEPFLVSSSLLAVMAQRLIRKLCKKCKEPYVPTDEDLQRIGLSLDKMRAAGVEHIYRDGPGCDTCARTSYSGRAGIYELMMITDSVRQLILQNTDSGTIKKQAMLEGMTTLRDDGARQVLMGDTSIAEILRATQEDKN